MYEQNLLRLRGNDDSAKAAEGLSRELPSFPTKFHGSCANCHHFHVGLPLIINTKPDHHEKIYCENCGHVLFGLGRSSPQLSLASIKTNVSTPTKSFGSPPQQLEKLPSPESGSVPTVPDLSVFPISDSKVDEARLRRAGEFRRPRRISIGPSRKGNAVSSTKTERAKAVLQGISSTARKIKPSFRKRTVYKPVARSLLEGGIEACRIPELQDDARLIEEQKTNTILKNQYEGPQERTSDEEKRQALAPPALAPLSTLFIHHKSGSTSDKDRNKYSDLTPSSRDSHFRAASVRSNQRSNDHILQKSSLERTGNNSYGSMLSIESSISIRYRSQDGQRQRIESHSKSEIAIEKHATSVANSTPTVADFFLVDNDDSDDDDNHGSTHSPVGPVEPKNSPLEKMVANDFPLGELDYASASRKHDHRITRLENNFLRLRFRCSCRHQFKIDILEHHENAAMEFLKAFDATPNPDRGNYPPSILHRIFEQARMLLGTKEIRKVDHILPVSRDNTNDADNLAQSSLGSLPPEPDRYICACFPGTNYKKYLHHVDANKARTDPMLFQALQQKYFSWRPLWKRMLALRVLARVEYFEVETLIHGPNSADPWL
ncbi:MAG: hypothetical protein Q9167_004488 [Letrouitia subvulpina]